MPPTTQVSDWVVFGLLLTAGVMLWVFSSMAVRDDAADELDSDEP